MTYPIDYFVYSLTFSSGKVYIGMSKTHPKYAFESRYRAHRSAARSGKRNPVYAAWRKYGDPQQQVLSLHETREACALAEIDAIQQYDSLNHDKGYNLMAGGEGLNAPTGSAMYQLMRERVWDNAERRKKSSAALKGRKPSKKTMEAYKAWCKTEEARAVRKKVAANPEWRRKVAENTRQQMANGGAEHLRQIKKGMADHLTPETRALVTAKQRAFANSPEGRISARKGYEAMAMNPKNVFAIRKRLEHWRESDANAKHCKEITALAAAACSRKVRKTGESKVFNSQREMARYYEITEATACRWVQSGKAVRV